eukprot:ctg_3135.g607
MPKITLISRVTDALPLAASLADDKDAYANELQEYERQAKRIVKNVCAERSRSVTGLSSSVSGAATVDVGYFVFHYLVAGAVVYLTLAEKAYPRKLAFAFLDELRREFETVYGQAGVPGRQRAAQLGETQLGSVGRAGYYDAQHPRGAGARRAPRDAADHQFQAVERVAQVPPPRQAGAVDTAAAAVRAAGVGVRDRRARRPRVVPGERPEPSVAAATRRPRRCADVSGLFRA